MTKAKKLKQCWLCRKPRRDYDNFEKHKWWCPLW